VAASTAVRDWSKICPARFCNCLPHQRYVTGQNFVQPGFATVCLNCGRLSRVRFSLVCLGFWLFCCCLFVPCLSAWASLVASCLVGCLGCALRWAVVFCWALRACFLLSFVSAWLLGPWPSRRCLFCPGPLFGFSCVCCGLDSAIPRSM
jgi:hypothetical protein